MSKQWAGGKGSRQRPTDTNKFNDNWDAIFKKPNNKDNKDNNDEEQEKQVSRPNELE